MTPSVSTTALAPPPVEVPLEQPTDDATRRSFLTLAGSLVLLAACGDDSSGGSDEAGSAPSTRTVETSHGPVKIPTAPERVVAMHDQLVAYSIASLGFDDLVGVAARDAGDPAAAVEQLGDVPDGFKSLSDVGTYAEPNLEAIAGLNPDLIIGLPYEVDPIYKQLSKIAPTVVIEVPLGRNRPEFDLQRQLAAVVGVEDELDERLEDYEARLAAVRSELDGALEGAAYTSIETYGAGPDDSYVIRSDYAPGLQVLEDLGMVPSTTTTGLKEEYTAVSPESMADFDADVIVLQVPEGGEVDPAITRLLGTTTAGQAGQIVTVSRDIWSVEVVEARFRALQDVVRLFGEADVEVSGDF